MFAPTLKINFEILLTLFSGSHIVSPMKLTLLTAVADSTATGLPVDVSIPADSIESAIAFLRSHFVDVDYDRFPNRITIFGDDQRIEGDEDEGLWVLNLVFPVTAFVDTNAI